MKNDFLKSKSYEFALESVMLFRNLQEKKEFILSKQFMRSATSVGANIRESKNAQSKADFIHKLSISLKECGESQYWLDLLKDSQYLKEDEHKILYTKSDELCKMLTSSIRTLKAK
jgi:four helix bundle protein